MDHEIKDHVLISLLTNVIAWLANIDTAVERLLNENSINSTNGDRKKILNQISLKLKSLAMVMNDEKNRKLKKNFNKKDI